jgi:hypothetical protein
MVDAWRPLARRSHSETPCHADGRACPLAPLRASSERSEGWHLTAFIGVVAHGTAQSARWFTPFTMTWLFTVMFMVGAWRPAVRQTTPNDHVMLTEGSISLHATALPQCHPTAQRSTAKPHVMLTEGSISPHATAKSPGHTMLLRGTAKHSESPCHADGRKHLTACSPQNRRGIPCCFVAQRKPMSC